MYKQTVLNRQRNSNYYYHSKKKNNGIDFEIECQCHSKFQKCQQDEIKEIIFELNKMKVTIMNPSQINQGKLKTLKSMKIS